MELQKTNNQFPASIEQLQKYILFSEERFKNISLQIQSIEKLEMGQEVHKQKLGEAQKVGGQVLQAKVKMGELLNKSQKVPKVEPSGAGSLKGSEKSLPDGINKKQSHIYQELYRNKELVEIEIAEAIENEDLPTTRNVIKKIREKKGIEAKQEIKVENHKIFKTNKKYNIIYADPPWEYPSTKEFYGQDVEKHYTTMSLEKLKELPVKEICMIDCVLYLWATAPLLDVSIELLKAWGFDYKTCLIWDKVKHNMGFYSSIRHEILLIGGIGSTAPIDKKYANNNDSVYVEERTEHSKKPEFFYELIEKLHSDKIHRIELFARKKKEGWDNWGNEI